MVYGQAAQFPAGVDPSACPNYPNCDNARLHNQPAPQQWNAPAQQQQWNAPQPQWNAAPQQQQWNAPQPQWNAAPQQQSWDDGSYNPSWNEAPVQGPPSNHLTSAGGDK